MEVELYGRLIDELKRLGVSTVLDSEGEPLLIATRRGPDVVSPNELEAEGLVGHEFSDDDDRRTGVGDDRARRPGVDHDARGRVHGDAREAASATYRATLEPIEPVSSVGSGDAFLAGFVASRYGGRATEDCLRFAVACGAESTQHFGAGVLEPREVQRLVPDVRVETLEAPALQVG